MMGILREFQIIAAKLSTEKSSCKTYIEEWFLELNGTENRRVMITFRGLGAAPYLMIDVNGYVEMDERIQFGSTVSKKFYIRNDPTFTLL